MSDGADPQDDLKFKAYLAQALQNLPRDAEGEDLRRAVSEYVEGRSTLSEVASTPSVTKLVERGLAAFDTAWSEMSPSDRGEAIEAGGGCRAEHRAARLTLLPHIAPDRSSYRSNRSARDARHRATTAPATLVTRRILLRR